MFKKIVVSCKNQTKRVNMPWEKCSSFNVQQVSRVPDTCLEESWVLNVMH